MSFCPRCGGSVDPRRVEAGYRLCLFCGEEAAVTERARWCVAPMHKSNYMLITDPSLLKGINVKIK